MNLFLHCVEDFSIVRGDTLAEPKLVAGDQLMQFDVVLANPPYSIKQWDRAAFASDPWGRNLYGTPPQGRADYAFWQHILRSLAPGSGRCAILFPHGVLFRQEEAEMRRKLVESDVVECVLGLGPNLFYNSPMEACVVICRAMKPPERRGRVLLINAVNEVTRERAQSFLTDEHISRIVAAYRSFRDEPGFAQVATIEEIGEKDGNLSISMYVAPSDPTRVGTSRTDAVTVSESLVSWLDSSSSVRHALSAVLSDGRPTSRLPEALVPAGYVPNWLNRSEWRRLPFGAFADSINERVEPADAADEIYVGLDDLDPGSLHIRRWGKGSDVIGTKLRFREGDIIFGRRRAYQRKLAVAEMSGICSAHAMVVRAKPEMVLPEFLPFLMMGDRFMNRAVEISVGSLSPTINWSTLRQEEFDLPPLDQQRRIAEVRWAVDEDEQHQADVVARLRELLAAELESELDHLFSGPSERLANLLTRSPESGNSVVPSPTDTGHYVLSLAALSRNGYVRGNLKSIPPTKAMLNCRLSCGDFLISRSNTQELVGLAGIFDEDRDDVSFPDTMMRLSVDETRIRQRFLEAVLQSHRGRLHMMRSAAGTSGSMKKINRRTLGSCVIPTPDIDTQEQFLARFQALRISADSAVSARISARMLKCALLESFLGGQM